MLIGAETTDGLATGAFSAAATCHRLRRFYGIAFLRDCCGECVARLCAVNFNLARGEINLDRGLRINGLHGVGDCAFAVAAGHSLNVEYLLHDVSLFYSKGRQTFFIFRIVNLTTMARSSDDGINHLISVNKSHAKTLDLTTMARFNLCT